MNSKNENHFSRRLNIKVRVITITNRNSYWKLLWKINVLEVLEHNEQYLKYAVLNPACSPCIDWSPTPPPPPIKLWRDLPPPSPCSLWETLHSDLKKSQCKGRNAMVLLNNFHFTWNQTTRVQPWLD